MVLDATPTRLRLSAQTEAFGFWSPKGVSVACLQFLLSCYCKLTATTPIHRIIEKNYLYSIRY